MEMFDSLAKTGCEKCKLLVRQGARHSLGSENHRVNQKECPGAARSRGLMDGTPDKFSAAARTISGNAKHRLHKRS